MNVLKKLEVKACDFILNNVYFETQMVECQPFHVVTIFDKIFALTCTNKNEEILYTNLVFKLDFSDSSEKRTLKKMIRRKSNEYY